MRASQDDLGPMKGLRPWMRRQRNSRAQGASQNSGRRDGSLFTAATVRSWWSTTAGASLRSTIGVPHMGFPLDRGSVDEAS